MDDFEPGQYDAVAQAAWVNLLTDAWARAEGKEPGRLFRLARPAAPATN